MVNKWVGASGNQHLAKDSSKINIEFSLQDLCILPFPGLEKESLNFSNLPVSLLFFTVPKRSLMTQ